jgi:phosphate transport system protein
MMRQHFEQQIERLNQELIDMGALCVEAIAACTKALLDNDAQQQEAAQAAEREIDRIERDIETLCLRLLLQQQPVARDLRLISAAMKMISDMERIGDQASDIADITRFITNDSAVEGKLCFSEMARATIEMVTDAVDSFVKKDIALARSVIDYDDIVDDCFRGIKEELIAFISNGDTRGELLLDQLMIAKYFERIGDHAVNIAEWVEYSITGRHPKLGGL